MQQLQYINSEAKGVLMMLKNIALLALILFKEPFGSQTRVSALMPDHCTCINIVHAVTTDPKSAHGGFMGRPQRTREDLAQAISRSNPAPRPCAAVSLAHMVTFYVVACRRPVTESQCRGVVA